MVKDLKVKNLGLTYHIWFVVMDFKNPIDSYDIILGRPFLRAAGVVHDVGKSNSRGLKCKGVIASVHMVNIGIGVCLRVCLCV